MTHSDTYASKKTYRILQVFSTLGVGGAETWLMALLRYLDSIKDELPFRVQIDICLTSGNKGVFDEEAAALGAKLFYPRYSRNNLFRFIREFRTILKFGNYDAIHDHQDYTAGFHFLFGMGRLPPVRVAHIHNPVLHLANYYTSRTRKWTAKTGKHILAHLATHVIGTSRQVVSEYGFDDKYFDKVKRGVVHCGFNVSQFGGSHELAHEHICREFGWESCAKILIFVGRLNSGLNQKNPGFALEVAKVCIKKNSKIHFLMAGGGDDLKIEFEDKVKGWGLEKSIRLIGARSDIARLMSGSDLFLFPSVAEGLGMVAVEAQAAGLRVLASDAVPRECEVIPGMVVFKPLNAEAAAWGEEVLKLMEFPSPDVAVCNNAVRNSPFAIENSTAALLKIYTGLEQ